MMRLTDAELEAYAVHAAQTSDRPLLALVAELQARRLREALDAQLTVGSPTAASARNVAARSEASSPRS